MLKLINIMPNKSAYEHLAKFQWFFIINILCVKRKSNNKRRYELSIMLIGRKNGKTLLSALMFMLLMIMSTPRAEYYSVAPDRELSSQLYKEFVKLIDNSPHISSYFKALRSEIRCAINNSVYKPLAYSVNRLDGRLASCWLSDETGALPTIYPIESMQSSQITLPEKMGIIISTAYETTSNPMVEQVGYAKKVLDKIVDDDTVFSLLYEPDNANEWYTDDSLLQANPLAYEVDVIRDNLYNKRKKAMEMPETLTNFKTKHLNIFVDGNELEQYVSIEDLQKCKIETYDWYGRDVYLGVDLSELMDTILVII